MSSDEGPKKVLNAIIIASFPKIFQIFNSIVGDNSKPALEVQILVLRLFALCTRVNFISQITCIGNLTNSFLLE